MTSAIQQEIRARSQQAIQQWGLPGRTLSGAATGLIAGRFGCTLRQVELLALEEDIVPERYCRNQQSLSSAEQARLLRSRVTVFGAGGLGGGVIELLARAGVGCLRVVDGDRFGDSNLNRQLLATTGTLDTLKANAAAERVAAINPAVEVVVEPCFAEADNVSRLLEGADGAADCLDTIPARLMLQRGCREAGVVLVSAALAGRTGQLTTVYPGDPGLEAVYGDRQQLPEKGVETRLGTFGFTAAAMAALQCAELVKILTGSVSRLRNRLLIVDLEDYSMTDFELC